MLELEYGTSCKKKEYYYSEIMIMIKRKNQIKPPFHTVKAATLAPAIL